ncbi:MAG TPA: hypothetical protein VEX12_07640 [Microbacterium sp.]|nr:hypothetical protein [Microbacterium sp.]
MSMRMTHPQQRTRTERARARRTDLAIVASPERTADVSTAPEDDRHALAEALDAARTARQSAERALHKAERERDHAARALELTVPPSHIDEAGRAELRAAYAEAADRVEDARHAFHRARDIVNAAAVIANAIEDQDRASRDLAEGLVRFMESRQS